MGFGGGETTLEVDCSFPKTFNGFSGGEITLETECSIAIAFKGFGGEETTLEMDCSFSTIFGVPRGVGYAAISRDGVDSAPTKRVAEGTEATLGGIGCFSSFFEGF